MFKVFKFSIILVIIGTISLIVLNISTKEYVSKIFKIYNLKKNIKRVTIYNVSLKKRLLNLQTKPKEIEKAVKIDLGYIGEDEILYKFKSSTNDSKKGSKK